MDIYSLGIIFFELFSGKNPFPGTVYQIYQAKISDEKPPVPSNFPFHLKELVFQGYSKEPQERPPIEDFQSALNKMLLAEEQTEKNQSITLAEISSLSKRDKQCMFEEKVKLTLYTSSEDKETKPKDFQAGNYSSPL